LGTAKSVQLERVPERKRLAERRRLADSHYSSLAPELAALIVPHVAAARLHRINFVRD
jgi:hypothetical protein